LNLRQINSRAEAYNSNESLAAGYGFRRTAEAPPYVPRPPPYLSSLNWTEFHAKGLKKLIKAITTHDWVPPLTIRYKIQSWTQLKSEMKQIRQDLLESGYMKRNLKWNASKIHNEQRWTKFQRHSKLQNEIIPNLICELFNIVHEASMRR
jgi:hypothetical protein